MPKKPVFKESDRYVVIYTDWGGTTCTEEKMGAKAAVNAYRNFREYYGDNVRLAKVVLNYGEEV